MSKDIYLLAIESSCDDTAAAVLKNREVLSNVVANQLVHQSYGGVVPELASRAHQANIIPVVQEAIRQAGIATDTLSAIAFTEGPGLLGSLLVGCSFAKSIAMSLQIPLIGVNHMQGHILAHFIDNKNMEPPRFPFLALTISGGHTQIVRVNDFFDMQIIGQTTDDAVGEAFDKTAKILGLPYPGGPLIDQLAQQGNPQAFRFTKPSVPGLDFSFSGLKTQIMYFIQREVNQDPTFIKKRIHDICASVQHTIATLLLEKLYLASQQTNIKSIVIGGGVSANTGIRKQLAEAAIAYGWTLHIPPFEYTTDNAAMIGITGYYHYLRQDFSTLSTVCKPRIN